MDQLNQWGLRVLGVAYKTGLKEGLLTLLKMKGDDSNRISLNHQNHRSPAIQALLEYGVQTKVLTGDNEKVTQAVCEKLVER